VAFPDRKTPGGCAFIAATLRSRDCNSLGDYGNRKLRNIRRFHEGLPCRTVVSMIEYKLDHNEARTAIHLQQPASERELLKLLSACDAKRNLIVPIGHFAEPTDSLRVVIPPRHVVEVRNGISRNKDDDDLRAVEDHVAPDNLVIADLAPLKQPHQLQSQGTALTAVFRATGKTNAQPCGQPLSNEVPREPLPKHLNPNAHSVTDLVILKMFVDKRSNLGSPKLSCS
jgi:hypothetical protein